VLPRKQLSSNPKIDTALNKKRLLRESFFVDALSFCGN
jgi:hypothetical protein